MPIVPQEAIHVAFTLEVNCCVAFSSRLGLSGEIVKAVGAPTVSMALAVYAVPPVPVAVTVHALPCVAEAVKRPAALMVPHDADHATDMFAVNCCVWPSGVVALAGEIAIGDVTVALVDAVWPLPSVAFAVMVHDVGNSGAVKTPAADIDPQLALNVAPLPTVNCWVPPSLIVTLSGEIENVDATGAAILSYP